MTGPAHLWRAAAWALALGAALAACGSDDTATTTSSSTSTHSASASASASGSASGAPASGSAAPPAAGLNTTIGPGPLTAAQARDLIVDFDNRLAAAYASGDTSHLAEFLAGTELSGNTATIQENTAHHVRNVFHVEFNSLTITSNSTDKLVFNLVDHTTDNHYEDTTTGETVNQGFPGPEVQRFIIFMDRNPANGTWYWTGAQKNPNQ